MEMDNCVGFLSAMEEMVKNPLYWDTIFICSDGRINLNKLVVGLIFPHLKSLDLFNFPFEATVILPDTSVENIQVMIKDKFEDMKEGKVDFKMFEKKSYNKHVPTHSAEFNINKVKQEIETRENTEVVNYFEKMNENASYDDTLFDRKPNIDFDSFDNDSNPVYDNGSDTISDAKFKKIRKRISRSSQKIFVDGVQKIECSECKEAVMNLSDHIAEKHADLDFKCNQCDFASGSSTLLRKHEKNIHKSTARECPICQKDIVCMEAHIKLVHGDRESMLKHPCPQCEKSFPRAVELRKHINTHLGLKEACHICGKEISINKVREHIRQVHEKIKNHFCAECGMGFYEKKSYTKHVLTHSTDLIICPDCGKQTKNIEVHMKRFHSGVDRRVVCPECGKKVVQLGEHVNSVHKKIREIQCPQCPRQFFKRDTLKRHLLCHEKGGPRQWKKKVKSLDTTEESPPQNPQIPHDFSFAHLSMGPTLDQTHS